MVAMEGDGGCFFRICTYIYMYVMYVCVCVCVCVYYVCYKLKESTQKEEEGMWAKTKEKEYIKRGGKRKSKEPYIDCT